MRDSMPFKVFLFIAVGLLGFSAGALLTDRVGWQHGDWIQLSQSIGLWLTGALGAWFVWHQNQILLAQNLIMERQGTQEKAIAAMQPQGDREVFIKTLAKPEFRRAGNQRGVLQVVGSGLRRRFPNDVRAITMAYVELMNEEPQLRLLPLHEFLALMRQYEPRVDWPDPA